MTVVMTETQMYIGLCMRIMYLILLPLSSVFGSSFYDAFSVTKLYSVSDSVTS
jgi:hypothetical protein